MLRTKRMKKVRMIVLRSSAESLIKSLHESGLMQIDQTRHKGLEEGKPLKSFDESSALLMKLRAALSIMEGALGKKILAAPKSTESSKTIDIQSAMEEARGSDLEERLRALSSESNNLSERLKELDARSQSLKKVVNFANVDFSKLETRKLAYRIGESGKLEILRAKLDAIPDTTVVFKGTPPVVLVLFDRKNEARLESVLTDTGFNDIELPQDTTTPSQTIQRMKSESSHISPKLEALRAQLKELSEKNIAHVRALINAIEIEAERGEIASRFSSTRSVYVIEGWALEEDFQGLKKLAERFGGKAQMDEVRYPHTEEPPIVLDNPKRTIPFEYLTKSYSLPNYSEIDPTLAFTIILPILYGMILGDVVYGFISFGIAYFLFKKFEKSLIMNSVCKIWMYSAIPTVIFGIIYDEWFGMSHVQLINFFGSWIGVVFLKAPLYGGFHRLENVLMLLIVTSLVGMAQLALGFIFGAINEWHHNRKHAIAKIAWLGIELGGLLFLMSATKVADPAFGTAGLVLLGLSVVILALTEGLLGIIELPGLAGNILSYTRIATIGVVGVVIAEMINELLIPSPDKGFVAIILIPIFIALHISNAFLAMFEAIIQAGRLNIVEFKSKFLHGGGTEYVPFALKKR